MNILSKFLTAAGGLGLVLVAFADGSTAWQPPPGYHPLPPELKGDLPAGETPQGTGDLRRTREALYGRPLSETQHQEVLSWRTHDLDWWIDDSRRAGVRVKLESLDALFGSLADQGDFADAVEASDSLFGLDVDLQWESADSEEQGNAPPPVLVQATVTYDARKRPDLFDFYELVHDFATSVAGSAAGEGVFLQVIEPEAETTAGILAFQATVDYVEALKAEIGDLTATRFHQIIARHVDRGWTYTAGAGETFQERLRTDISDLVELRTVAYLASLHDTYKKRLAAHVIEEARAGLWVTRGYYSRTFKERQAGAFEALLASLRGGAQ
ncbi:MAG: hypothetical protein KDD47_11270 [Acidobacteria bacterium]|nr:hypothetical protein [Acidobacteriota bacterium]